MKGKKWVLIISAIACFVLAGVIIAIGVNNGEDTHIHGVTEAREYHIGGQEIYYTQACKCGDYTESKNINLSVGEVFASVTAQDSIILDDNVEISNNISLLGYEAGSAGQIPKNTTINLDLNGHTFTSSADNLDVTGMALFSINSSFGTIKLNIKNGELLGGKLKYIFNCKGDGSGALELTLSGVDCTVDDTNSTTLRADESLKNSTITAQNCTFTAFDTINSAPSSWGVLINSDSDFTFNNCQFEGTDAVYVRRGDVTLNGCKLISSTDAMHDSLSNEFASMGTCLVLDCNTSSDGQSVYNVKLNDCCFDAKIVDGKQCVIKGNSCEDGLDAQENDECVLEINNCKFSMNVSTIPGLGVTECTVDMDDNGKTWYYQ